MLLLSTRYSGTVSCAETDLFQFPQGLPAFEHEKSFVVLDVPGKQPFLLLQSVNTPALCFIAIPVPALDPQYELSVSYEDLCALDLPVNRQPAIGSEALVLALVSVPGDQPATANLMAPVVMNTSSRLAVQAVRSDTKYSHQRRLNLGSGAAC